MAKITALAPWFGSNRMLAKHVGEQLDGCEWVGIPFAGGMCEIAHIKARTIVANDAHALIINLANVVQHPDSCKELERRLRRHLFHPLELQAHQLFTQVLPDAIDLAEAYFASVWMTRSGLAGTDSELKGKLALRWEAGGGDSAKRYQSAIDSLDDWCKEFKRCTFSDLDVFEFLPKCKDRPKHGIYVDPPFPGPGDKYKHTFTKHAELESALSQYQQTRVVCRFYDVPLIRELYPIERWTWHFLDGRKQTNERAPEVLIVRN